MHKAFPLSVKSSHCQKKFPLLVRKVPPVEDKRCHCQEDCTAIKDREMKHSNTTFAKIPILDTGNIEQWQFKIQQYLQHEHYALWEVIEFEDSYKAPKDDVATGSTTKGTGKKKGRTVALTTKDMQKRKNDVKARTTLLLALPDEHKLRFSKYKTAQELWAAILKTFRGNEATKKTKKNLLKQQYGNFKAEGSETMEQTFNRLQAIVSHLEFMDIEIEQDDLNQKFLTKEIRVKFTEYGFYFISQKSSGKEEVNTTSIPTASTNVSPTSANIGAASISQDTACAYIASQIKFEEINQIDEDDIEEMDIKWNMALLSMRADRYWKRTGKKITIQGWDWSFMANEEKNHALVADEEAPTEFALMAKTSAECEDLSWTRLPEFANDTVTDYSRPSPAIESTLDDLQNRNSSVTETEASHSNIISKPFIKFVKATDSLTKNKADKVETVRKTTVKYAELYRKTSKKSNVRGSQRNWNNLKSQQLGKNFVMKKACYNCGGINHLSCNYRKWVDHVRTWAKNNNTHKSRTPIIVFHKTGRPPMRTNRPYMNVAQPKRTSFYKPTHSYNKRPFQRTSAVRS
nr:hypothetical protein [Tanacetum cinerariifolium]